jgi:hypothetical protein
MFIMKEQRAYQIVMVIFLLSTLLPSASADGTIDKK